MLQLLPPQTRAVLAVQPVDLAPARAEAHRPRHLLGPPVDGQLLAAGVRRPVPVLGGRPLRRRRALLLLLLLLEGRQVLFLFLCCCLCNAGLLFLVFYLFWNSITLFITVRGFTLFYLARAPECTT